VRLTRHGRRLSLNPCPASTAEFCDLTGQVYLTIIVKLGGGKLCENRNRIETQGLAQ
jgi:hypothetical protein